MNMAKETQKERLLQQFIDNRPLGMNIQEDMEDFAQELELMELEGINLDPITVRDVIKRLL